MRTHTKRVILAEGYAIPVDEKTFDHHINSTNQPVLVDFWADWCQPCHLQAPILDQLASKHADTLKVIKVEAEKAPLLMERFSVDTIPTMILFVDGKAVSRVVGAHPLGELERKVLPFT